MLVLSRKVDEAIQIGDDITIVVTKIAGNRVTLGVSAPGDVSIMRGELRTSVKPAAIDIGMLSDSEDTISGPKLTVQRLRNRLPAESSLSHVLPR